MAASLNSLVATKIPTAVATDISDATPTVAVLMAYGVHAVLATEIVACISAGNTVPEVMAAGMPYLAAQEIYDAINP